LPSIIYITIADTPPIRLQSIFFTNTIMLSSIFEVQLNGEKESKVWNTFKRC